LVPSGLIAKITNTLGAKRKRQVLMRFREVMKLALVPEGERNTVLDLGGPSHDDGLLNRWFSKVVVLNLDRSAYSGEHYLQKRAHAGYKFVVGDGRYLPFKSSSIGFIFCDQVIEHIPKEDRTVFAGEIERVAAKGYIVSTPNLYFPFEPHYHLPLVQYLPERFRKTLAVRFPTGWMNAESYHAISLLTAAWS
jgi:ubiquinone/menaquinone biosynthesis C-methylase UbiE